MLVPPVLLDPPKAEAVPVEATAPKTTVAEPFLTEVLPAFPKSNVTNGSKAVPPVVLCTMRSPALLLPHDTVPLNWPKILMPSVPELIVLLTVVSVQVMFPLPTKSGLRVLFEVNCMETVAVPDGTRIKLVEASD